MPPPAAHQLTLDADGVVAYLREVWPETAAARYRITELRPGLARLHQPSGPQDLRPGDSISGPVMMELVDSAAFVLVLAHLGDAAMAVTSHLSIEFLRRGVGSALDVECTLHKLGRTQITMTCHLTTPEIGRDKPVAISTVVYSQALLAT